MKQTNRFLIATGIVISATILVIGGVLFFVWQHLTAQQVQTVTQIVQLHLYKFLAVGFIVVAVVGLGLESIYENYIHPIKKISAGASVIYSSNPSHRIHVNGSQSINALTGIINNFADMFENLSRDITEQILASRTEVEKEKNLLASIMAELPQGVIICNRSGRILLFNSRAKHMFTHSSHTSRAEHFIGLGRSIFHLIDKDLVAHAIEEIEERLNKDKQSLASYFITPIYTGILVSIEAIPILDEEQLMTGFILTFKDISYQVDKYENIDNWLQTFRQTLNHHFEQTRGLIGDLIESSETEKQTYNLYEHKIQKYLAHIEDQFKETQNNIIDASLTHLPLSRLNLGDFLLMIQQQALDQNGIRVNTVDHTDSKRLLADSYSFAMAFNFLFVNLSDVTQQQAFDLTVKNSNGRIFFEISWPGRPASRIQIEDIITKKIRGLPSFGYILKQNQSEFQILSDNMQSTSLVRITANAEMESAFTNNKRKAVVAQSRPEFYDFDLFKIDDDTKDIFNRDLRKIIFTVFDTETTGLDPDGGDEIISIAAVRVVNGRIVYQDIFEELVDPKRDIPIESYRIHGINYEMLRDKPDIQTILPLFKMYTYDTVLVGHNIAFDMKMFKVKEKITDTVFDNPVLDTLLLSASLYPVNERHDMENIAKRLGVNIIGRHTALGDAIATAEIFTKLIPLLNSNGIFTLKNALEASKKSYYARLKY